MSIIVRSKGLKDELRRRRDEFSRAISAVVKVPPDLAWVWMQEHGTATRGDFPTAPFDILPKNAKALSWFSEDLGRRIIMDMVRDHPGIPAKHFIAESLEEIHSTMAKIVAEAMVTSGYNYEAVHNAFLSVGMEEVKKIITEEIAEKLMGDRTDGKLHGQSAAEAFEQGAFIEDRS